MLAPASLPQIPSSALIPAVHLNAPLYSYARTSVRQWESIATPCELHGDPVRRKTLAVDVCITFTCHTWFLGRPSRQHCVTAGQASPT